MISLKNHLLYFLLFVIAIGYTSCCSVRGTSVKHYYFKTILAEKFISNQPDSLVFIDNHNNLHIYNGVYYHRFLDTNNECHECCEDNEIDRSRINYTSKDNFPNFWISMYADKLVDYLSVLYLGAYSDTVDTSYYRQYFSYVGFTQADSVYLNLHPVAPFSDSVKLLNRTFYDVYTFEKQIITPKIYPQKLFYCPAKGIVGIQFNNNDIWELQP